MLSAIHETEHIDRICSSEAHGGAVVADKALGIAEHRLDYCISWFQRWLQLDIGDTLSASKVMTMLVVAKAVDGAIDQAELYETVGGNRSAFTRALGRMLVDGLVVSEINPTNRTKRIIKLSDYGREILKKLYAE